jgi:hypothetical protein
MGKRQIARCSSRYTFYTFRRVGQSMLMNSLWKSNEHP